MKNSVKIMLAAFAVVLLPASVFLASEIVGIYVIVDKVIVTIQLVSSLF